MSELTSRKEIDDALASGKALTVVGLNGRGIVQLQLPDGCNIIQLTAVQAVELASVLVKHAARATK